MILKSRQKLIRIRGSIYGKLFTFHIILCEKLTFIHNFANTPQTLEILGHVKDDTGPDYGHHTLAFQ
jgi:hypothetical protein